MCITNFSITAELSRALAVVKVTSQINGKTEILVSCLPKNTGAIEIKPVTIDYISVGNPHAKFGNSQFTGDGSPYG